MLLFGYVHTYAGDGEFAQADIGSSTKTGVLVKSIDAWQASATYSDWNNSGRLFTGSVVYKPLQISNSSPIGIGIGAIGMARYDSSNGINNNYYGGGAKLMAEGQLSGALGSTYVLGEASTVFNSWLVVAQYSPPGMKSGIEYTALGDNKWFNGQTLALRIAVLDSNWHLRIGARNNNGGYFLGLSYTNF